jgi:hypothetical protein
MAPDGAVPGAVVRAERLVGDVAVVTTVPTDAAGRWRLDNVKGGRYRVRAWRPPDLAQVKPEIFFLDGSETKSLVLRVGPFTGTSASPSIAPSPPVVDNPANLLVRLASQTVDADGVVRTTPMPGHQVELVGTGDWTVQTPNPQTTDGSGVAGWRVICRSTGDQSLSVQVDGAEAYALALPGCVDEPRETTTTSSSSRPTTTTTGG